MALAYLVLAGNVTLQAQTASVATGGFSGVTAGSTASVGATSGASAGVVGLGAGNVTGNGAAKSLQEAADVMAPADATTAAGKALEREAL